MSDESFIQDVDLRSKFRGEIDGIEQSSDANKLGLYRQLLALGSESRQDEAHVDTSEMGLIR
jgi:hypothetical protein